MACIKQGFTDLSNNSKNCLTEHSEKYGKIMTGIAGKPIDEVVKSTCG